MIDKDKTYRTRDGREVRIYATDGAAFEQVHGAINNGGVWYAAKWNDAGRYANDMAPFCDLIPADPHGILPRHRELLAEAYESMSDPKLFFNGKGIRDSSFEGLSDPFQAALIALAKLDNERGGV